MLGGINQALVPSRSSGPPKKTTHTPRLRWAWRSCLAVSCHPPSCRARSPFLKEYPSSSSATLQRLQKICSSGLFRIWSEMVLCWNLLPYVEGWGGTGRNRGKSMARSISRWIRACARWTDLEEQCIKIPGILNLLLPKLKPREVVCYPGSPSDGRAQGSPRLSPELHSASCPFMTAHPTDPCLLTTPDMECSWPTASPWPQILYEKGHLMAP